MNRRHLVAVGPPIGVSAWAVNYNLHRDVSAGDSILDYRLVALLAVAAFALAEALLRNSYVSARLTAGLLTAGSASLLASGIVTTVVAGLILKPAPAGCLDCGAGRGRLLFGLFWLLVPFVFFPVFALWMWVTRARRDPRSGAGRGLLE